MLGWNFGCTDDSACSYDSTATNDDGSCSYPDTNYDCDGICLNDSDSDGVCDELEVAGCTDASANNFNVEATDDDGSCEFDSSGDCVLPEVWEGNTGSNMTVMLTSALISSLNATDSNAYLVALTSSGLVVGSASVFGVSQTSLAVWGDDTQTIELDGAAANEFISFQLINGTDLYDVVMPSSVNYVGNGLAPQTGAAQLEPVECESSEVFGCTDASACNYDANATDDDGSCTLADVNYDCDGTCLNDSDSDGVCDELEVSGCTDASANNFNAEATDDDESCDYGQSSCVFPEEWEGNTGVNMTVFLTQDVVSALPITSASPYLVALTNSGLVVGSASLATEDVLDGQQYLAIWGDDTETSEL